MKRVGIIQVGVGLIGGTAIEQALANSARWRQGMGLDVVYTALIDSRGGIVAPSAAGFDAQTLTALVAARRAGTPLGTAAAASGLTVVPAADDVAAALAYGPSILVDSATGTGTASLAVQVLNAGGGAVFSNKAPFALPLGDPLGDVIWSHAGPNGRVRYETTCGAGLPVISTLRGLLDSGDEIREIVGTVSGTFGAIFSQVAAGSAFSAAVHSAKAAGYTEPDPRDDLSGLDVARKALILARTIGLAINLDDIAVSGLVPEHLAGVSVDDFMARVSDLDAEIGARAAAAKSAGKTLKYACSVNPTGAITVGLQEIPVTTVLGALQGPENIISIRTARYDAYPMNITGPGAGAAVTAAGAIVDVLALANGPVGGNAG